METNASLQHHPFLRKGPFRFRSLGLIVFFLTFWGTVGQWRAVVPEGVECKPVVNDGSLEVQEGKKVFGS